MKIFLNILLILNLLFSQLAPTFILAQEEEEQPAEITEAETEPADTPEEESQIEEEREELVSAAQETPAEETAAEDEPILDSDSQATAIENYDNAAQEVAGAADEPTADQREAEQAGEADAVTAVADVVQEAPQALEDAAGNIADAAGDFLETAADGLADLGEGNYSLEVDGRVNQVEADLGNEENDAEAVRDILSGNLSEEQNALIRLNLGLPVTAAETEVLGFLDQLAASSNVQLEGTVNGTDLSKVKSEAERAGKQAVKVSSAASPIVGALQGKGNLLSQSTDAIFNIGADASQNRQDLESLEQLRINAGFKRPAFAPIDVNDLSEETRLDNLAKLTEQQVQAEFKKLQAEDAQAGGSSAEQFLVQVQYAIALKEYDKNRAAANEKFGQAVIVLGVSVVAAAAAPFLAAESGTAALVSKAGGFLERLKSIGEGVQDLSEIGSKGIFNVLSPGKKGNAAQSTADEIKKVQEDLDKLTKKFETEQQPYAEIAKTLTPERTLQLQNLSPAQIEAEIDHCKISSQPDSCDAIRQEAEYAGLLKKQQDELDAKTNVRYAKIGISTAISLAKEQITAETIKGRLKKASTVVNVGAKAGNVIVNSINYRPVGANASVPGFKLVNNQWVEDNPESQYDVLGVSSDSDNLLPLSRGDYAQLKTQSDMLAKFNATGKVNFDEIKKEFAENLSVEPQGRKKGDDYQLATSDKGIVSAFITKGVYVLQIPAIAGVDVNFPQAVDVGDKEITIPIGLIEGTGKVTPKGKITSAAGNETKVNIATYYDENNNGKWDSKEHAVPWAGVEIDLKKVKREKTISLLIGWNLVTLTALPEKPLTAATMLEEIASQGGYGVTVSTLDNGAWKSYVVRGDKTFSDDDFTIEPGKAYFVKALKRSTLSFKGQEFVAPLKLDMKSGWNAVGFPYSEKPLKASDLKANTAARWESGAWDTFVKLEEEYGNNFPIEIQRGYIIKAP